MWDVLARRGISDCKVQLGAVENQIFVQELFVVLLSADLHHVDILGDRVRHLRLLTFGLLLVVMLQLRVSPLIFIIEVRVQVIFI